MPAVKGYRAALNPFSASPIFGQVQKFFLENLLLAQFYAGEIYQETFFLEKGLNFVFHINIKKKK